MLYIPSGALPPKKSATGIARGRGGAGFWLRSKSIAVQPRTHRQNLWRQVFSLAKRNWLGIGANGQNNAPTNGIDPQAAWTILAGTYQGILQAGWIEGNIQTQSYLIGCSTTEAFQVMVQTSFASMGLGQAPTPAINTSFLTTSNSEESSTDGSYQFVLNPPTTLTPNPLSISLTWQVSVPGNVSGNFTLSASALPSGVTASFPTNPVPLVYDGLLDTSSLIATATLNLTPNTAPAAATAYLTIAGNSVSSTLPVALSIATGYASPVNPSPLFAYPEAMTCATVYDSGYNVTGFQLVYGSVGTVNFPMTLYGEEVPGLWLITASPSYTSSYNEPPASSWSPILLDGPYMPSAADVLSAWVNYYGALPASASIKFAGQYMDPTSGCVGPELSCSASFAAGTLKGALLSAWTGPIFAVSSAYAGLSVTAPGSQTATIQVQGSNGYGGTITFEAKSKTIIYDGNNQTTYALPDGVTFSFSPASVTIPSGSTAPVTTTLTVTAVSGATEFAGPVSIQGTDGIATRGVTFEIGIEGDVTAQGPLNYLSISPTNTDQAISIPGTASITFTLSNTNAEDQFVIMLASYPNTDLSFSFDNVNPTVPGGTESSPGTTTVTLTITVPSTVYNPGTVLQIEASAGVNSCYAAVQITL